MFLPESTGLRVPLKSVQNGEDISLVEPNVVASKVRQKSAHHAEESAHMRQLYLHHRLHGLDEQQAQRRRWTGCSTQDEYVEAIP